MGQISLFARLFGLPKPEPLPHVVVRHVVATKAESAKVRAAREKTTAELRRYVAQKQAINAVAEALNVDARLAYDYRQRGRG